MTAAAPASDDERKSTTGCSWPELLADEADAFPEAGGSVGLLGSMARACEREH
jgi:hypothetical protein